MVPFSSMINQAGVLSPWDMQICIKTKQGHMPWKQWTRCFLSAQLAVDNDSQNIKLLFYSTFCNIDEKKMGSEPLDFCSSRPQLPWTLMVQMGPSKFLPILTFFPRPCWESLMPRVSARWENVLQIKLSHIRTVTVHFRIPRWGHQWVLETG